MSERVGLHPPAPEMRRGAPPGTPLSQNLKNSFELYQSLLDLQARKLRRPFFFCHATARRIATLAHGVTR